MKNTSISKQSSINERVPVNQIDTLDDLQQKSKLHGRSTNTNKMRSGSQISKQSSYYDEIDSNLENINDINIQDKKRRSTFVTGLIDQDKQEPHIETKDQLDQCVDGIENQFQNVLTRHENDFVQAYRGHMQKVQKELIYLKNKANETAGKILNDDSITNLQNQIGWFKNEATKLDTILETQKRELQKLKSRELNINEDRKFLKDQTKDAMKNNKLLQVALKKTQEQNKLLKQFLENNKIKRPKQNQVDQCQLSPKQIINKTMAQYQEPFITQQVPINNNDQDIDEQSDQAINNKLSAKNLFKLSKLQQQQLFNQEMLSQDSQDFKIKEFVLDLYKRRYSKEKIELKILKFFKLYDISRDDKIEDLQRKLEIQKRNNMKIKNNNAQDYSDKSEIENLFLDCIDECKKDILKRNLSSNGRQSSAKFQNNAIQESTALETQALLEQIALNKDVLITVFEEVFGSGGYVGATIGNLENQIKQKKFSVISQANNNNSISYFSNATTKDNNQSEEIERMNIIMNAPIENLLNNMSEFSLYNPQNNLAFQNNKIGIRKFSANTNSIYNNKRASTAIGGHKGSTQANTTALTYYNNNDLITQPLLKNDQKFRANLNQSAIDQQSFQLIQDPYNFKDKNFTKPHIVRANTSHSQHRGSANHSRIIIGQQQDHRSRQNSIQPQTQHNNSKSQKSQERSFTVKNGKLVMNNTTTSFKQ